MGLLFFMPIIKLILFLKYLVPKCSKIMLKDVSLKKITRGWAWYAFGPSTQKTEVVDL